MLWYGLFLSNTNFNLFDLHPFLTLKSNNTNQNSIKDINILYMSYVYRYVYITKTYI